MEITRREALMGSLLPLLELARGVAAEAQTARPPDNTVFQHDLPNVTMAGQCKHNHTRTWKRGESAPASGLRACLHSRGSSRDENFRSAGSDLLGWTNVL
jgi:hypothetical protein